MERDWSPPACLKWAPLKLQMAFLKSPHQSLPSAPFVVCGQFKTKQNKKIKYLFLFGLVHFSYCYFPGIPALSPL